MADDNLVDLTKLEEAIDRLRIDLRIEAQRYKLGLKDLREQTQTVHDQWRMDSSAKREEIVRLEGEVLNLRDTLQWIEKHVTADWRRFYGDGVEQYYPDVLQAVAKRIRSALAPPEPRTSWSEEKMRDPSFAAGVDALMAAEYPEPQPPAPQKAEWPIKLGTSGFKGMASDEPGEEVHPEQSIKLPVHEPVQFNDGVYLQDQTRRIFAERLRSEDAHQIAAALNAQPAVEPDSDIRQLCKRLFDIAEALQPDEPEDAAAVAVGRFVTTLKPTQTPKEIAHEFGLSFWIENRDGIGVLVHSKGGIRPATLSELELWNALRTAIIFLLTQETK